MYAVIKTGGKQYRVEKDQVIKVELLGDIGSSVDLSPVMIVDGETVLATPSELAGSKVTCLLYTSPSPRDGLLSRMPSSA